MTRDQLMRVAQAIATEAVVGVFLRDGRVEKKKVDCWIDTVLDDMKEPEVFGIFTEARKLVSRMIDGAKPAKLNDFL